MGKFVPPLYGIDDAVAIINKITDVDEKINALLIQREAYVEDLKKAIEKKDTAKA
jgi:hypothetical protein